MIVLVAVLLAFLPVLAMLYPFLRKRRIPLVLEDESSVQAELGRRWEASVEGLRNIELERALGSLEERDYQWLRQHYLSDAATLMKAMELEQQEEEALLQKLEEEVAQARQRILGGPAGHVSSGNGEDNDQAAALESRTAEGGSE